MTNALWNVWNDHPELKLVGTTYTIHGFSIAALRTNFYIRELNLMLDAGLSANLSPDVICVTHTHSDHCANLPYHLYSIKPNSRIKILVPNESEKLVVKLIDSAYEASTHTQADPAKAGYDLITVSAHNKIDMLMKNRKISVEIIQCYHSIPCVGYGFSELVSKLKPEYMGKTGREIAELRRNGVVVIDETPKYFFCFLGDTDKQILDDKVLEKYQTIMIECTFILENEIEQADKTKHIHWCYLEPYILAHSDIHFILYHFSQRYNKTEIREFFEDKKINNITVWAN